MRVFRISKPDYVTIALQGQGAALVPGRWNSAGVRLAYTASSVSLAMLEMLVHVGRDDVPDDRRLLTFDVPDDAVAQLPKRHWPEGWDALPYSDTVRAVGDRFVAEAKHLALRVPSAVARHEFNLLINPGHPRFAEIARVSDDPLALDPRLFD